MKMCLLPTPSLKNWIAGNCTERIRPEGENRRQNPGSCSSYWCAGICAGSAPRGSWSRPAARTSTSSSKDPNYCKEIEFCEEFAQSREKAHRNLVTERGALLRVNRSIQVKGAFGILKSSRPFKCFLMWGRTNIPLELFLLCLAFDLKKYWVKLQQGLFAVELLIKSPFFSASFHDSIRKFYFSQQSWVFLCCGNMQKEAPNQKNLSLLPENPNPILLHLLHDIEFGLHSILTQRKNLL